ncbi:MAG: cobalamin-dependent protein [Deltaproteobacteria bacterium]|nr:cobalamin-dependent protein [Deltaproteobacteria bacterium]
MQPLEPTGKALLACVEGERHVLPLQGAALRLTQQGYRTLLLGADTPAEALGEAVRRLQPELVGLSMTPDVQRADPAAFLAASARACAGVRWAVGGAATRSLAPLIRELGGELDPGSGGG